MNAELARRVELAHAGDEESIFFIAKLANDLMNHDHWTLLRQAVAARTRVALRGAATPVKPARALGRMEGHEEVFRFIEDIAMQARVVEQRRELEAQAAEENAVADARASGGLV